MTFELLFGIGLIAIGAFRREVFRSLLERPVTGRGKTIG